MRHVAREDGQTALCGQHGLVELERVAEYGEHLGWPPCAACARILRAEGREVEPGLFVWTVDVQTDDVFLR